MSIRALPQGLITFDVLFCQLVSVAVCPATKLNGASSLFHCLVLGFTSQPDLVSFSKLQTAGFFCQKVTGRQLYIVSDCYEILNLFRVSIDYLMVD